MADLDSYSLEDEMNLQQQMYENCLEEAWSYPDFAELIRRSARAEREAEHTMEVEYRKVA